MATDLEQTHFRFRTDGDAADATPTWGGNEDANYDPGASPFRLRMGLANLGDASSGSLAIYLQKNAGSYAAITTAATGGVKSYDASSDADDTPIRIPRLSMSAEWRLAGAALDLDFAGNRIYPSGAFTDYLSCSRASIGYGKNADGTLTQFASNVPRITSLGLLGDEDATTNYIFQSQDFSTTWLTGNAGLTTDQAASPDGTTTMDQLNDQTSGSDHFIYQQRLTEITANTTRTYSVFAKDVDRRYVELLLQGGGAAGSIYCFADLQTGTIVDSGIATAGTGTTFSSATIEAFTNNIYRIMLTGIVNDSDTSIYHIIALSDRSTLAGGSISGDKPSYTGSNKSIYIWGAQAEEAAFSSSYIPTTTTSATRAADVVTCTSDLQTYIAAATASIVIQIDNGMVANVAANIVDSNGTNLLGFDASNHGLSSLTATLATGNTANRTTQDKLGLAWNASGRSLVLNGGTVATDATAQTPSSTQHIGSSGTDNFAFAYVERLTVWTSKLADGTLQGFTS